MAAHRKDLDDSTIIDLYLQGKSSTEIAKQFGTSHRTILLRLKKHTIERRTLSESQWNFKSKEIPEDFSNKEVMERLYLKEGLSKKELGIRYNCDPCVIDRVLKNLGIKIRNNSESKVGLMTGDNHPNWKGGISTLSQRLREYCGNNSLKKEILNRDKNKCIDLQELNLSKDYNLIKVGNYKENISSNKDTLEVLELHIDNNKLTEKSYSKKSKK